MTKTKWPNAIPYKDVYDSHNTKQVSHSLVRRFINGTIKINRTECTIPKTQWDISGRSRNPNH